jgi:hypothetical protein
MATKARVKRGALRGKGKPADRLAVLDGVVNKGLASAKVSGSQVATAVLTDLKDSKDKAKTSMALAVSLDLQARAAKKTAQADIAEAEKKASTYANAVDDIAQGDSVVITDAGLTSRDGSSKVTSVGQVVGVKTEQGKQSREGIVRWPEVPGAGAYAVRVNFTPGDPTKVQDLPSGTSRKRTIVAPAPGAQFTVWVAAIGNDELGPWSDPASCTAR